MKINELNYEQYALDYIEGNLDVETRLAMDTFFDSHPALKEEIIAIGTTSLPNIDFIYDEKDNLLKKAAPIRLLPIAFAISTAACLILAVGFLYLLNQKSDYGQLAYQAVQLNIDIDLPIAEKSTNGIKDVEVDEPEALVVENTNIELLAQKNTDKKNIDNVTKKEEADYILTADVANQNSKEIEKLQPITIEKENNSIINATVQLTALSNNLKLIDDKNQLEKIEKEERKKVIKQGVKSLFQNALLPEGLTTAFNN